MKIPTSLREALTPEDYKKFVDEVAKLGYTQSDCCCDINSRYYDNFYNVVWNIGEELLVQQSDDDFYGIHKYPDYPAMLRDTWYMDAIIKEDGLIKDLPK